MSKTVDDLLLCLADPIYPDGMTCTEIGETLWRDSPKRSLRQSYARPAGKLVKRAIAEGLVVELWGKHSRKFKVTREGRQRAAMHHDFGGSNK